MASDNKLELAPDMEMKSWSKEESDRKAEEKRKEKELLLESDEEMKESDSRFKSSSSYKGELPSIEEKDETGCPRQSTPRVRREEKAKRRDSPVPTDSDHLGDRCFASGHRRAGNHGSSAGSDHKIRKENMKNASFLIKKHEESVRKGKVFTQGELDSYKWAKETVKTYNKIDAGEASSSGLSKEEAQKRNRSLDNSGRDHKKLRAESSHSSSRPQRERRSTQHGWGDKRDDGGRSARPSQTKNEGNKRAFKRVYLDNLPFNEVLKQDLKVCIVDHNVTDLRITPERFGKVDEALFQALYEWINAHPGSTAPVFDSNERYRGYIVINCDSGAAVEFLKLAVSKMGHLWSDAKLAILHLHEIPALPKIYASIPLFVEGANVDEQFGNKTLTVLKGQNSDIPMQSWKLMRVGKVIRKSVLLTFVVDKESFAILEKKNFSLTFVRSKLTVGFSRGGLITEEPVNKEETIEKMLEESHLEEDLVGSEGDPDQQ